MRLLCKQPENLILNNFFSPHFLSGWQNHLAQSRRAKAACRRMNSSVPSRKQKAFPLRPRRYSSHQPLPRRRETRGSNLGALPSLHPWITKPAALSQETQRSSWSRRTHWLPRRCCTPTTWPSATLEGPLHHPLPPPSSTASCGRSGRPSLTVSSSSSPAMPHQPPKRAQRGSRTPLWWSPWSWTLSRKRTARALTPQTTKQVKRQRAGWTGKTWRSPHPTWNAPLLHQK